jgi:hypothetical protein
VTLPLAAVVGVSFPDDAFADVAVISSSPPSSGRSR